MDIFYTAKELADILKVDHRTVIRMIYDGRLRGINVGSEQKPLWRIYDGELKRFMAESYEKYAPQTME